ncbi:MAG: hypothetical protein MUF19_01080 [Candidatus Pacebacteria bacterium]|jgi:hypothetical protein|nr:hypothetical protein [Candidatus Paceibacterota bacterium]
MERLQKDTKNAAAAALSYLQTIKREEQRLAVRLLAVERCARLVAYNSEHTDAEDSEEEGEFEEIIANVEAVRYDLSLYMRQVGDRVANIERGLKIVADTSGEETVKNELLRYIEEDARLCARDLAQAREGYDDLIENIQSITHTRDQ